MLGYFSLSLCHFQSTLFIKSYPVPFLSPHPHTHTRRSVVRSFILNVSNRSASSSFCSQSNSNQLYATHPPNCLSFSASFYVTNVQCRYKYTDTPTHAKGHSRTQDSPLSLSLSLNPLHSRTFWKKTVPCSKSNESSFHLSLALTYT